MLGQYEVIGFVGGESEDSFDTFETQRDAMGEVEHLASMQPENVYVVFQDNKGAREAKVVVVDGQVFLPM